MFEKICKNVFYKVNVDFSIIFCDSIYFCLYKFVLGFAVNFGWSSQ